ncbi:plasmodesmata-located protein 7-like [Vitis riparia]|uniref:plasmodesmata-located protein 7-like n=1 Tax=Vitis riparia TaxID=96939 RepID=UPI00155A60BB|nr:plasmodesmata-located protein 7-like [Vitis riparia]
MEPRTLHLLPLFTSLVSLLSLPLPSHSSNDDFVFMGCSQIKYTPNSPYESNLDSLLTSLANSATYSTYNNFTIMGSSPQDVVYGLYQCRGDLSMPDCATCVARAVSQLGSLCSQTCGGALQLQGCFVKYDNDTFLGVEDKTVVLKKCGPSVGYEAERMGRRDAVLGSMEASSGGYRVGGSGDVQGVAQCVGDLSVGECQDCVSEAISRLKSDCGTAVYGDMFLGKCYARYTTAGAHTYAHPNHDSSHDDGEKTFAIIVGLLAGVALIIIFLTFMRKVFEGNGK